MDKHQPQQRAERSSAALPTPALTGEKTRTTDDEIPANRFVNKENDQNNYYKIHPVHESYYSADKFEIIEDSTKLSHELMETPPSTGFGN